MSFEDAVEMTSREDRLYIAVRNDLPVGLQMAQAVHAAFLFAGEQPDVVRAWMKDSQYLVVVAVSDEDSLWALVEAAARMPDVDALIWREPDLPAGVDGWAPATAVAFTPGVAARRLCANLPLAGRSG